MIAAPILVALLTAILCLLVPNRFTLVRVISMLGSIGFSCSALYLFFEVVDRGPIKVRVAGWPEGIGISLYADMLSAMLMVVSALVALCGLSCALASLDRAGERRYFHSFYHFLMMAISGAFLTNDLFNLYVWFEAMLISTFALISITTSRPALVGGIKYTVLNLLASFAFLIGLGLLYGATGTFAMSTLAQGDAMQSTLASVAGVVLLSAFLIKAGSFPVYFWLPAAYPHIPACLGGVFAGLLTKIGTYAIARVFAGPALQAPAWAGKAVVGIAAATMVMGVLGAVFQRDIKRILSYHTISQNGYMVLVLGIAMVTESDDLRLLAVASCVFFLVHHIAVKSNLFFVAAAMEQRHGSLNIDRLGRMKINDLLLSTLFLVPAFALIGLPPTSGFWAKFFVVRTTLGFASFSLAILALVVSSLTLYSMMKIWVEAFWNSGDQGEMSASGTINGFAVLPLAALCVWTFGVSVFFDEIWAMAMVAASQVLNPQ